MTAAMFPDGRQSYKGSDQDAKGPPESETPLGECSGPFSDAKDCPVHKGDLLAPASCGHNDRFKCVFGLPREDDGCLACALERTERQHSLAQTEIKGHMRVQDELREAAEAELDLRMQVERDLAEAQARLAELEKDWETDADYIRMAERIKELENDAAALRDALRPFVRIWPNTVSTISLHIAEEMLAKGYAYDVTRDAALKSRA